jgi:Domain of unknown function (DUF4397)
MVDHLSTENATSVQTGGPGTGTVRAAAVTLLLVLIGLLASPAVAGATAPAGGTPAYLRLAHLSPDTPKVDVYVDSAADPSQSFSVPGVGYGTVSDYRPMPPGDYVISMRPAGAPATTPPVISTTVSAKPGAAYTVAGTGRSADLGLSVLSDKLDMPPAGKASVRVINAALSVPTADVGPVNGPAWAQGVAFGTETDYRDCPLGNWNLKVSSGGTSTTLPLVLKENSTYTVLLVDKGNGLEPEVKQDSRGSGTVPVGGVDTGMGGAANAVLAPAVVAVALIGGVVVTLAARRRSAGH